MRRPFLRADWSRAVFIHYEVERHALQRWVPFELHLREGRAYVSLVAFTIRRLRPGLSGRFGERLLRPFSEHGFLNVRTYVRAGSETGIYFLAEWLSNRLAVPLGRPLFGLPYYLGEVAYRHEHERGCISGKVTAADRHLRYHAELPESAEFAPSDGGSLDEFLLERYTAFTHWRGLRRFFRVWHAPWPLSALSIEIDDDTLLEATGDWRRHARIIGGHYSPGVHDVWMGHPQRLHCAR